MAMIQSINLALRFLLELCVLAALGDWGFHTGHRLLTKCVLGIGVPILCAFIWGTFGAPGATVRLSAPIHLALECVVFGSAVAALFVAGRTSLAYLMALAVVVNRTLMFVWGQ